MDELQEKAVRAAVALQAEVPRRPEPHPSGNRPRTEGVLPRSLASATRGYIERVVDQINACYESGAYDACAVMVRRLVETLIIEVFEAKGIEAKLKTPNDDYKQLRELVIAALAETSLNLSRNTRRDLPLLKDVGDLSAHSRRYNAQRDDVDRIRPGLRVVVQELISLAGIKRS